MGCVEGQRKNRPIMEQLTYHLFCLVAKLGQKFVPSTYLNIRWISWPRILLHKRWEPLIGNVATSTNNVPDLKR